jgi:hypothetical protein
MSSEFARSFAEQVMPSELNDYKAYLHNQYWALDQCAALLAGLNPDCYTHGRSIHLPEKEFKKRSKRATQLFHQLLEDIEKQNWRKKDLLPAGEAVYVSAWKCIKWVAQERIFFHSLFFEHLPLHLKELYFEFQPINVALRTASRYSRAHQEAYYLDHVRRITEWSPQKLPPTVIYNDAHMQDIQRYIRELGGNYKKRTILGWISKEENRPRGRPKKA